MEGGERWRDRGGGRGMRGEGRGEVYGSVEVNGSRGRGGGRVM